LIAEYSPPSFLPLLFIEHDDEFEVDLTRKELNHGFMVAHGVNVQVSTSELVDALTFTLEISDMRDYEDKKYSATLLEDGTGIEVVVPTLPHWLYNNVDELEKKEQAEACSATFTDHKVFATNMRENRLRQTKRTTLRFPDEMTCNKMYFNGEEKDPFKLQDNLRIVNYDWEQKKVKVCTFGKIYIWWKVAIDGESRRMAEEKKLKDPIENALAAAIKSMSI
jgi:hypothetical protein